MRLKVTVEEAYRHRFDGWFEVKNELADLGWDISFDDGTFDVEMIQNQLVDRLTSKTANFDRPIIVYERNANGSISPNRWRQYLKHPKILGYAKELGLRDKAMYNYPHLDGRYFLTLISDEPAAIPEVHLDEADLEKVEAIFQVYAQAERYAGTRFQNTPKWRNRTTDVFFSGFTEYDLPVITEHRHKCCDAIAALNKANVLIGIGRSMRYDLYAPALADSKIFVSPYGYGEYSWKDFEAIYSGCILIKPQSDFVIHNGFDIFKKDTYSVTCKPDFSDLGEIVDGIKSDIPKWAEFAASARAALEAAAIEKEHRARDIAGFLSGCMARLP